MPISFQCPECAKSFNVRDELAGKKARCKCGAAIQVPQPVAPAQQQPADPLLGPLSPAEQPFDPLTGSMPPAQPPADPLMGPQAVDPLAGFVSPASPAAASAGRTGIHIGVMVGAGVGGVGVIGLIIWMVISLVGVGTETGAGGGVKTAAAGDTGIVAGKQKTSGGGRSESVGTDDDEASARPSRPEEAIHGHWRLIAKFDHDPTDYTGPAVDEISFAGKQNVAQVYFDTKQKKMFSLGSWHSYYISGKPADDVLEVVYHDFDDGSAPLGEQLRDTTRRYFMLSKSGKELEIRMQKVDYKFDNLFIGSRFQYVDGVTVPPGAP